MAALKIASLIANRPEGIAGVSSSASVGAMLIENELESLGADLLRLSAPQPRSVARAVRLAGRITGRSFDRSQSLALIRRANAGFGRASGRVILAMSSSIVEPPRSGLVATRNDATIKQLVDHGVFGYGDLSERVARAAIDRDRRWARRSVLNVCHSQWQADSIIADYGVEPDRTLVNGQPFEPFSIAPQPADRDWSTPKFLFAGLDWKRKNGDRVLEGFRKVRAMHPEAELHLMGRFPQVDEPGVTSHGFLSADDERQGAVRMGLFASCTCLVVPSLIEPGGHVHAEALNAGMPAIGTKVGGNREVIGPAGMVVEPTDQRELTDAMLTMCDPDRARSMGDLGPRQVAGQAYSECASEIYVALRELLPRSVGGLLPD